MNNKILKILRNTVGFFNMFNLKLNFLSCPTHNLVFFIKCRNARGHNFYMQKLQDLISMKHFMFFCEVCPFFHSGYVTCR